MQHVVMVVPIDAEKHEAQDVGQENRHERSQRLDAGAFGNFQLQNHDRDQDRDHAIAECFEPALRHLNSLPRLPSIISPTFYRPRSSQMKPYRTLALVAALFTSFGAQSIVGRSPQQRGAATSAGPSAGGPFDTLHFRPIGPASMS